MREIKKISADINKESYVVLKTMGDVKEIRYLKHRNNNFTCLRVNKDFYMIPNENTGELYKIKHQTKRIDDLQEVSHSLSMLRDLINCNVTQKNKENVRWITLTYKENMQDTKRLYNDFKRFFTRFKRLYSDYKIEYIVACEPQARGAWHMHCLFIFDRTAPFIANNDVLAKLWGNGFTKVKRLSNDLDNLGAYLSAYLSDLDMTKTNVKELAKKDVFSPVEADLKKVSVVDGQTLKEPKKIIKGGRLHFYPSKFNIYRCSRGVKRPLVTTGSYHVVKEKAGLTNLKPTYSKSLEITCDNNYKNTLIYEYYNTARKEKQWFKIYEPLKIDAISRLPTLYGNV